MSKIVKYDNFGRGITYINNKITFVDRSFKNDDVDVLIYKENKKYIEGVNKNFINNTRCKYYDKCGGCNILHLPYKEQLEYKLEKINNLIKKNINSSINITDIVYSDEHHYRNKITLHIKDNRVGLYEYKSNNIVEIDKCILVDNNINEVIGILKEFLLSNTLTDNEVIIKCFDDILILFKNPIPNTLKEKLYKYKVSDGNKISTNITILDKIFKVSNQSFFQVNKYLIDRLYSIVIDYYKDKNYNNILDLYCGTGTISILVSKYVKNVVGVEIVESAVEDANYNKKINDLGNVEFLLGRVEDYIDKFKNIDSIIVDPPRSGLDKKTIESIISLNADSIVYVSCNPDTLIRDLNQLKDIYEIKDIKLVDMFPNTYHCESVCILERR